jgi:S-adenosylmethionine decarboxylase
MFGPHLILEGYNCKNKSALADQDTIKDLLNNFPAQLDMNIIMPPKVMDYDGGDIPEDSGVSGFVIIAESHIAIHTFPQKGFFTLDIFSCKPFEIQKAIDYVVGFFQPESFDQKILDRGREFPRSLDRSQEVVDTERTKLQNQKDFALAGI